jgi:hypothetical protein
MNVEQLVEWEWVGETKILRENSPLCHYVKHKPHMSWPGIEPGGKPETNPETETLQVGQMIACEIRQFSDSLWP